MPFFRCDHWIERYSMIQFQLSRIYIHLFFCTFDHHFLKILIDVLITCTRILIMALGKSYIPINMFDTRLINFIAYPIYLWCIEAIIILTLIIICIWTFSIVLLWIKIQAKYMLEFLFILCCRYNILAWFHFYCVLQFIKVLYLIW